MAQNRSIQTAISPLTNDVSANAFSLVCEQFVDASVLHTATDVTLSEYRHYMRDSFEFMRAQDLSLVAIDTTTNEMLGCLIACDYGTSDQGHTDVPSSLKPINALLQQLDDQYRRTLEIVPGQHMLIDMAVVKPSAGGQGIYRSLREAAHQLGRESGFKYVVGELSSAATQHLCTQRLGHKVCAEIAYASFDYQGQRPFATIKEPPSIMLVEGELIHPE